MRRSSAPRASRVGVLPAPTIGGWAERGELEAASSESQPSVGSRSTAVREVAVAVSGYDWMGIGTRPIPGGVDIAMKQRFMRSGCMLAPYAWTCRLRSSRFNNTF